jgi:hypothetical protein
MVEKEDVNVEEMKSLVSEIVSDLSEYLKEYIPERKGYTKHSVMGPVGKLISVLESGRFENKDALLGYVINVHNNTSKRKISAEGLEHLKNSLNKLEELRNKVNIRVWIRLMREIDYAVYKNKMEQMITGGEEDGDA